MCYALYLANLIRVFCLKQTSHTTSSKRKRTTRGTKYAPETLLNLWASFCNSIVKIKSPSRFARWLGHLTV